MGWGSALRQTSTTVENKRQKGKADTYVDVSTSDVEVTRAGVLRSIFVFMQIRTPRNVLVTSQVSGITAFSICVCRSLAMTNCKTLLRNVPHGETAVKL
jgi:hypothetical protein